MTEPCVFCDITLLDNNPSRVEWSGSLNIGIWKVVPRNPVVEGHVLVFPRLHVEDAAEEPAITGAVFAAAAHLARRYESFNLITSVGKPATQSIKHLHIHIVPRTTNDGLTLPWTGQQS